MCSIYSGEARKRREEKKGKEKRKKIFYNVNSMAYRHALHIIISKTMKRRGKKKKKKKKKEGNRKIYMSNISK
jgi:hypothetical protein